jgi:hypothetical protein
MPSLNKRIPFFMQKNAADAGANTEIGENDTPHGKGYMQ